MSFFDSATVPEPPEPEPRRQTPAWFGPPLGVLSGQSTQQAVVFGTDRAILVLRHFEAYPTGIEFSVDLRVREPEYQMYDMPWELTDRHGRGRSTEDGLPDDLLRLGFGFADGATWTNLDSAPRSFDEPPTGPVVIGRGGSSGGDHWKMKFWMWPLPPEGDIAVHAAWPAFGIEEVSATIDGTLLRSDALNARELWSD